MDRSTGSGFACRLKMEQTNVAEDVMVETTADANKGFKGLEIFWIMIYYTFLSIVFLVVCRGIDSIKDKPCTYLTQKSISMNFCLG